MLNDALFAAWFFIPAGVANTIPILAAKMPLLKDWNTPVDFGKSYGGKRILGSHKTWRGIISGVIGGFIVFLLQRGIALHSENIASFLEPFEYLDQPLILGVLLGLGALVGDSIKSFFKRSAEIEDGKSWFPFDQLDYIVGGCLFAAFVYVLPLQIYIWITVVWFLFHVIFSYVGYKLHLKDAPI